MVRPDAAHVVAVASGSTTEEAVPTVTSPDSGASIRTDTVLPTASAICDASVRFQIRS
jgi:hypothetical protein